ncbi:MAG: MotA/TolQ/ExbB proton channel family protein, partial [Opitutales bacterium]|nr:MotA/TolQ/ExbB proton channel family protein [Opitutales bacterium]
MMKKIILPIAALLTAVGLVAQSDVDSSIKRDLDAAISELNTIRETIKNEKIPLGREMSDLEGQLRLKRQEVERSQRLKDNASVDLNRLEDNVVGRREQIDYMANLVSEYGRSFEVRVDLAEAQNLKEKFDAFNLVGNDSEMSKMDRLNAQIDMLATSMDRIDNLLGGYSFKGQAVNQEGTYEDGSFVVVGPIVLFANEATGGAGLAISSGSLEPSIYPLADVQNQEILNIVTSGEGKAPLDPTLGDALAIKREEQTILEHIQSGGIWVYPILGFAMASFLTALFKAFEIYSVKLPEPGTLQKILGPLNEGKLDEAKAHAESVQGPAGKMLYDGVLHSDESKELVEEVMYESMIELQPKMERLLPFIAVTAATAPLMGLLGTVTGMINTFKLITIFGTGDAKSLSGGISEALVTTEFGLIVAIPSLILHSLLSRRSQGVLASMERLAVAFVNGLNRKN